MKHREFVFVFIENDPDNVASLKRGTFVSRDVENCYWETRDHNGKIIDDDFVVPARRVVAKVSASAVVFTSVDCGKWDRQ